MENARPGEEGWRGYQYQIHDEKIGGTPPRGNSRSDEIDSLAADEE